MSSRQAAPAVLMVRPAAFGYNAETAASNRFQRDDGAAATARAAAGRAEFDRLCAALRGEGVEVCVVEDTPEPPKPDALFPNNWVSFHADGTVVLYPMLAREAGGRSAAMTSCRRSRRSSGFPLRRILDLTHHETQGRFLEGTGSLVLDRVGARRLRLPFAAHRRRGGRASGRVRSTTSSCCSMRAGRTARRRTTPT